MSKVLKNISYLGILQIANYLLPIIYIPFVSRIIGPEGYGIINYAFIIVSYFTAFIAFGFDYSATRIVAVNSTNDEIVNKTFSNVFYAQILLFICSSILFTVLIFCFPVLNKNTPVTIYTFLLCIASLFTQNWMFQAKQDLGKMALLNFISKLLITIIIVIYVREKEDLPAIPLISSIIMIIIGLSSFLICLKMYNLKFVKFNFYTVINTIKNSVSIYLAQLMTTLYNNINVVVMGLYSSALVVGLYTAGQKLITLEHVLISFPVNIAIFPVLSKKMSLGKDVAMQYIQKIYPIFVFLFIGLACMNLLLSPFFIKMFYGASFLDSVIIMQILCFLPFFSFSNNFIGVNVLFNLKKEKTYLYITLFSGLIGVLVNFIFANQLSYLSAAIAWFTSEVICFIMVLFLLGRENFFVFKLNNFKPSIISENLKSIKVS